MSISSTGLYGSATIVNTDLFDDVEALKEQVTSLSTSYLTTTNEHRILLFLISVISCSIPVILLLLISVISCSIAVILLFLTSLILLKLLDISCLFCDISI